MCVRAVGGKHAPIAVDAAGAKSTTKIRTENVDMSEMKNECKELSSVTGSLLAEAETLREGFRSLQIWLWTHGEPEHQVPLTVAVAHHKLADDLVVKLGGDSVENEKEVN